MLLVISGALMYCVGDYTKSRALQNKGTVIRHIGDTKPRAL